MAKTYEQLQKQIAQLQAEAEQLRRDEVTEVIARMRQAIDFYRITAADLGFGATKAAKAAEPKAAGTKTPAAKRRGARKAASAKPAATVLYRDDAGNTWVGRGKRPQWLRAKLEAGHKLEEFKVGAAAG